MSRRTLCTSVIAVLFAILVLGQSAFAWLVISPYVSESVDEYGNLEYTVHNPLGTGVSIIAILVSNNSENNANRWVDEEQNLMWNAEPSIVTSLSWDDRIMGAYGGGPEAPNESEYYTTTTWEEFTGLPFYYTSFSQSDNLMGYFLEYYYDSDASIYVFEDISQAIAEGETRGGFYVGSLPASDFLLVGTDDLDDDSVDPASIQIFEGQAVPEPITMLFVIAGMGLVGIKKKKS